MRTPAFAVALLLTSAAAFAAVSPDDTPLPPGQITRITVAYGGQDAYSPGGRIELSPGEYHYDVYLPEDYDEDRERRFPCLFIADAGGNARLGAFEDRVKREHMIAVMLVESRNGKTDPIVGNFLSAHDDAVKRLRIAPGFKYMTGMSGGARSTAIDTSLRPGFSGILLQGAGLPAVNNVFSRSSAMAVFATFGINDGNRIEVPQLALKLPTSFNFRYRLFDGGHQYAPKPLIEEGMDYLEHWTYFDAPLVPDGKPLYVRYFDRLMKQADEAESDFEKYDLLETAARFAQIRNLTKDGAIAARISAAKKRGNELAAKSDFKRELDARASFLKIEKTEDALRRQAVGRLASIAGLVATTKKSYELIAASRSETLYGKRAADEAKRLELETGVDISTQLPPPTAKR